MAVIKIKCNCGKIIEASVGDSIYNNNLRWYQSYYCKNCGNALEMDEIGVIPFEIKKAIMIQEGSCELFLLDYKSRKKVSYLLNKMPYMDSEWFKLFEEEKSNRIVCGTQNEVTFIKEYLEAKGIKECELKVLDS